MRVPHPLGILRKFLLHGLAWVAITGFVSSLRAVETPVKAIPKPPITKPLAFPKPMNSVSVPGSRATLTAQLEVPKTQPIPLPPQPPEPRTNKETSPGEDFYALPLPTEEPKATPAKAMDDNQVDDEDDLLLPKSSDDIVRPDEVDMNKLLEQREQSVTPYPKPDISTPAEKVIPIPVIPAPEDFKGFEPPSPGDWNLPEPRRVYPLPKIEKPVPNASNPPSLGLSNSLPSSDNVPYGDGTRSSNHGSLMPWQAGASSTFQFESLFDGNSSIRPSNYCASLDATSLNVPMSFTPYNTAFQIPPIQAPLDAPTIAPQLPTPQPTCVQERLSDKYWKLHYAKQLPYRQSDVPVMSDRTCRVPYEGSDFAPIPFIPKAPDPHSERETYFGKVPIDTQRPWVEWWRPFYTGGTYEPGIPVFSDVNLLTPGLIVYGDYRNGVGVHRNNGQPVRTWANRLNLDIDMRFTGTERFHMFTGPLDHNGQFTRLDFSKNPAFFETELDFQPDTAFFEGDLGAITGSVLGTDAPFDLPFTCGLIPLLYQNGIWMEDAIAGFAFGAPWRNNRALNWANYEATFFAGFNQVTSPAFQNNNNAASVFGTAWFVEAYNGYIEADYAYLDDLDGLGRSYHNAAIAYTRRYFGRISNSVRLIGNAGQSGPAVNRSADGGLLLIENSLITSQPSTVVPYCNFFVGSGRPQSVARAGGAGGILRNTGINFETDGLTGYPTLNATGSNSYGGAVGINILSADFRQQWVTEFAALDTYGDPLLSAAAGPEYALGTRYQRALSNRFLFRTDFMNGWFDNAPDIYGTRMEFRWKF